MILLLGPILLIFVPQTIADIFHYQKGAWDVLIPQINFISFGVGFLLLFLICMILFFSDLHKISIYVSTILACLAFGSFFLASQAYATITDKTISFSSFYSLQNYQYSWQDVEKIIRTDDISDEKSLYEMVFEDGNRVTLERNDYFLSISKRFSAKVKELGIEVEVIENN